jgi:hypothetical protein
LAGSCRFLLSKCDKMNAESWILRSVRFTFKTDFEVQLLGLTSNLPL